MVVTRIELDGGAVLLVVREEEGGPVVGEVRCPARYLDQWAERALSIACVSACPVPAVAGPPRRPGLSLVTSG